MQKQFSIIDLQLSSHSQRNDQSMQVLTMEVR